MKMSVNDKLKVIKAALEQGASIDVNFHLKLREEAEEVAKSFSPLFNQPYYYNNHGKHEWFKLEEDPEDSNFQLTIHHE